MNMTPLAKYLRENSIERLDFALKANISISLLNKLCAPAGHQCLYATAKRIVEASGGALKTSDFDGETHEHTP